MRFSSHLGLRLLLFLALLTLISSTGFSEAELKEIHAMVNGLDISSNLALGRDGNFYGTTERGGPSNGGSIFRLTPEGKRAILHYFDGKRDAPFRNRGGASPQGKIAIGEDGSIYGATRTGGLFGTGVIYRLSNPGRKFETLHDFRPEDGSDPRGVVLSDSGDLYGIMGYGGELEDGNLFRLSATGEFKLVFAFGDTAHSESWSAYTVYDPGSPWDLFFGSDGFLYGATLSGGPVDFTPYPNSHGVIYRFDADNEITVISNVDSDHWGTFSMADNEQGWIYCVCISNVFKVHRSGDQPLTPIADSSGVAALTKTSDGSLYGIRRAPEPHNGATLFRIETGDKFTAVHSFSAASATRFYPEHLTQGSDGGLYGYYSDKSTRIFKLVVPELAPPNMPPLATSDEVRLDDLKIPKKLSAEDRKYQVMIDVLKNDDDADGDTLKITTTSQPKYGTISLDQKTNLITYYANTTTSTPQASELKADEFSYSVSDGKGGTASAKVFIYPQIRGTYEGTLSKGVNEGNIALSISPKKHVTGRLKVNGNSFLLKGELNIFNQLTARFDRNGMIYVVEIDAVPEEDHWRVFAHVEFDFLALEGNFLSKQYLKTLPKRLQSTADNTQDVSQE